MALVVAAWVTLRVPVASPLNAIVSLTLAILLGALIARFAAATASFAALSSLARRVQPPNLLY